MKLIIEIREDMIDIFEINRFKTTFDKVISDIVCVDTVTADEDDIDVLRMVRNSLQNGEIIE